MLTRPIPIFSLHEALAPRAGWEVIEMARLTHYVLRYRDQEHGDCVRVCARIVREGYHQTCFYFCTLGTILVQLFRCRRQGERPEEDPSRGSNRCIAYLSAHQDTTYNHACIPAGGSDHTSRARMTQNPSRGGLAAAAIYRRTYGCDAAAEVQLGWKRDVDGTHYSFGSRHHDYLRHEGHRPLLASC